MRLSPPLLALSLAAVGTIFGAAAALAAPTRVFFTEYQYNNPKIKGMELDGSNSSELFALPPSEWLPVGCDYDEAGAKVYWTHGSTPGTIRRANLDGSEMQLLVSGLKLPRGIAVDPVHGKIYWVQAPPAGNALGLLKRANLDGTSIETVYSDDPYDPTLSYVGKPTVDPVNGYVYFCARGEIRRARLDLTGSVETVVRGVTTVAAIALDTKAGHIYFADANTNSDYIGRARFDDSEFTMIYDNTPGFFGTSGLFDMKLDLEGGRVYWTDELAHTVRRAGLDGLDMETLYTSPAGLTPTGMTLDTDPQQAIQDCNGNGTRDLDDVAGGSSADCNGNGIPDECESAPCVPIEYLVDNGSDPSGHRTLSGNPANGFEVFQPIDLSGPARIASIGLDGWTTTYHPAGFTATLFPDDGTGAFPDEGAPIASAVFQWRFSNNTIVWVDRAIDADLPAGRSWVRLTAADPAFAGAACYGLSGPPSFSRRLSDGQIYYSSRSIALRLQGMDPAGAPETPPAAGVLSSVWPNPTRGPASIRWEARIGAIAMTIHDAAGRRVRDLGPESLGPGLAVWDGKDDEGRQAPPGIYFVHAILSEETATGAFREIRTVSVVR